MRRPLDIRRAVAPGAAALAATLALGLAAATGARAQETDTARTVVPRPDPDTTARLTGTVASNQTGGTIASARVILPELGIGDITDSEGRFTIDELPPGLYDAKVEYFGYSTNQRPVRLEEGSITRVTFLLDENVLEVAELEVEVKRPPRADDLQGFYWRKKRGFGFHFGPEDIEERNPSRTSDLVRSVPSIYVRTNNIQGRGIVYIGHGPQIRCRPKVWVDGVFADEFFLDDIDATALRAVEVYRRPSETPPEFEHSSNRCGTIVIWTRHGPREPAEGG